MNPKSFNPIANESSRILILGTMPSVRSREDGFYYAHPRNRFWRVIAACFGQDVPQTVSEKKQFLFLNGVALWDVLACCEIHRSDDASIRNPVCNDISAFVQGSSIEKILCNGAKAFDLYSRNFDLPVPVLQMPSTSPANAAWSFERLLEIWKPEFL